MLKMKSRIRKIKDIPWKKINDEVILVDVEEGEVIRLRGSGAEIWSAVDGTRTAQDIIGHLSRDFSGGRRRIEKEVFSFLKKLIRMEILGYSD